MAPQHVGHAFTLSWSPLLFFAIEPAQSARPGLLVACALFALSIIVCAAFLTWMRRITG
ncbi:hypothetical protein [Bradyrhizobium sp. RDI18]|uniref:hypothetical protein n=1 Tax=Bradyrhizobium sp. RDI18 TaxID=3367400 RepID=UPI00371B54CE